MTRGRNYLAVGILVVILCMLLAGLGVSIARNRQLPAATCTVDLQGQPLSEADMGLPAHVFVGLGVASLVGGHLFGRLRSKRELYQVLEPTGPRRFSVANRAWYTLFMTVVFLGIACVLFYEALGVLRTPAGSILQPITYYMRCAIHYDMHPNPLDPAEKQFPVLTTLVVVSFCFLMGHWLWYPAARRAGSDST
jgi:hypothetical protein